MSEGERVYFQPGANPPFPGYEAWLEAVKRAPIWQAKGPRPYVPDMRDGLGKELFPPPPPRSNLEPEESRFYDRETAVAAMDFIWETRPDLVWEMMWWMRFFHDDPEEGERADEQRKYDPMCRHAVAYEFRQRLPELEFLAYLGLTLELQRQLSAIGPSLPLDVWRAPWVDSNGLMREPNRGLEDERR